MSRAGFRSPPAASRQMGSRSAASWGGKRSGGSSGANQVITARVSWPALRLAFAKRGVLVGLTGIGFDRAALALQICADGTAQRHIGNPVRRPGQRRLETACDLVLALRPGLEALETLGDAVVDALVIAGLEMEAVIVGCGAPVASIQGVGRTKEHGRSHRLAGTECELHQ